MSEMPSAGLPVKAGMDYKDEAMSRSRNLQFRRSYVIVTESEDGTIYLHDRPSQPCWGELRKYERTAAGRCTQPEVNKPGDLYYPFPDGKPIGIATSYLGQVTQEQMDILYTKEDSPLRLGANKIIVSNIIGTHDNSVFFDGLDIDPTVLIWSLRYFRSKFGNVYGKCNNINKCLDAGMSVPESILIGSNDYGNCVDSGFSNQGSNFSVARFLNGTPNDWSGGSMQDRVDYNRPKQDYLWRSDDVGQYMPAIIAKLNLPTASNSRSVSMSTMVSKAKEVTEYCKTMETPRPVHIWKTSKGVTNAVEGWKVD